MNPVYNAILSRRSCRFYTNQPISPENLHMILTAGTHAPSAMNSQTRQFTVLRTRENIAVLAEAAGIVLGRSNYDLFKPAVLVIVSDDAINPNSGFDCACALENIFLMAHELGIGSCWINQMKDAENHPSVRKLLSDFGVPPAHHVYGMAALGYAAVPASNMDKSKQVIHFAD